MLQYLLPAAMLLAAAPTTPTAATLVAPPELDRYNLVWTSPSTAAQGSSGSMPIGNGTVGANVWVEEDGDLLILISRTDAWSETDRLLKLGRVRLHMDPNPFEKGQPYRQELKLRDGRIEWTAGKGEREVSFSLWVDWDRPKIHVEGEAKSDTTFTATLENWRTEKKILSDDQELMSSWTLHSAPKEVREAMWESADEIVDTPALQGVVTWYHRNEHSCVPLTLTHQGLDSIASAFKNPILHRTFGGGMSLLGANRASPTSLAAKGKKLNMSIVTHSAQTPTAIAFLDEMNRVNAAPSHWRTSQSDTEMWWSKFWDRSWIFVDGDTPKDGAMRPVPKNNHPLRIGADSNGQNVFRGSMSAMFVDDSSPEMSNRTGHQILTWWAWMSKHENLPPLPGARYTGLDIVGAVEEGPPVPDMYVLNFKGGSCEVPARDVPDFAGGFTLTARIKPNADLGPARIFDKMTAGGSAGFIFDTYPGDSLRLIVGDLTVHAHGVLKRGEWQDVGASYDPYTGVGAISLDGKMVATGGAGGGKWNDTAAPSRVTQAYVLQRWMDACGGGSRDGKSDYPIKFNGSIFTVEPAQTEGQKFNPDWRKWGGCFWWQNTRLPYYPMLAAGDFDMMDPLFRFYENALPGSKARTTLYYGAKGVYWPETMTTFGTYGNGDYGWKRDGLKASDIGPCPWWQWAWNQSLELTQLMLDHAAYTGDEKLLKERAIPMARETLLYFDTRFTRDAKGKLLITPTQAVETYWHEVVNDAPVVGGLHTVCDQLLALPASMGTAEDRALWKRVKEAAPPLSVWEQKGKTMAAPAEKFKNERSNCETPELYPLWPFREYGLGKANLDLAIDAYNARVDKSTVGWTQDGMFAAKLGLTDEAQRILLAKATNSHKNHRFSAMWGPNFDWLPDQDHGGNLMLTTQLMLMQADPVGADGHGAIRVLPAWPKEWNVSFKLHAPGRTTVECEYRGGKIEKLVVMPEERRADVVVAGGQ